MSVPATAIKPKMYFTSKADKTSQNVKVMDFVIGLLLDLNDVQNESLRKWDLTKNKKEQMSRKRLPMLLSNFLLVCLSPTETCQRIRSPPCRGSSFSISNSTSCKSPPPTSRLGSSLHPFIPPPPPHPPAPPTFCLCFTTAIYHTHPHLPMRYLPQYKLSPPHFITIATFCRTKPVICLSTCKKNKPIGSTLAA